MPLGGVVEPLLPPRVEVLLDGLGQAPERYGPRWLEDFAAAVGRHGKDGACLREVVRARESATKRRRPEATELALRVPPLRDIHLAEPRHDQTQPQEPVEIDRVAVHRSPPSGASAPPARTQWSTSDSLNFHRRPIL